MAPINGAGCRETSKFTRARAPCSLGEGGRQSSYGSRSGYLQGPLQGTLPSLNMSGGTIEVSTKGKGLRHVAEAAGVSVATVWRVSNGSSRVDPELRKSILAAASKLGIDLISRNRTLAFVLANRNLLHPFHGHILVGAEDYARSRGWDMLFLRFSYSPDTPWKDIHLPPMLKRRDVAQGIILSGTNSQNLLEAQKRLGTPLAILGNNIVGSCPTGVYDMVFSDDIGGAHEMTRYLLSLGHRDIWFVGNTQLPWFARGYSGYKRAMEEEVSLTPHLATVESMDEQEIGYLATKSILGRGEKVSAIFAGTDPVARGVYKAAHDLRLRIPQDISVVGCNDIYGTWLHPGLTTIREFPEQLGKKMAELVLNRIFDPGHPAQEVTIPSEIVKRESCLPMARHREPAVRSNSETLRTFEIPSPDEVTPS